MRAGLKPLGRERVWPTVSSAVAVGLVWSWIYGKDTGLLNYAIESLGGRPVTMLIFNSLKIAFLTTVGQLITCAMAAFAFAVVRFRGREALFIALLATLMIPAQVTLVPNFILFKWLGLIGTQAPLWLPALWGGAFGTFLLRQYFLTVPFDIAEAARGWRVADPDLPGDLHAAGAPCAGCAGDLHLPGRLE